MSSELQFLEGFCNVLRNGEESRWNLHTIYMNTWRMRWWGRFDEWWMVKINRFFTKKNELSDKNSSRKIRNFWKIKLILDLSTTNSFANSWKDITWNEGIFVMVNATNFSPFIVSHRRFSRKNESIRRR